MKTKYIIPINDIIHRFYQYTKAIKVYSLFSLFFLFCIYITINASPTCTVTAVYPTELAVAFDGSNEVIEVTTVGGCTTYTVSSPTWITYNKVGPTIALSIQPNTGCLARTGQVKVGDIVVSVTQASQYTNPNAAGPISGPAAICAGQTSASYSVEPIPYAESYVWSFSGVGATIVQSYNSITLNIGSNFIPGTLSVHGVNGCGVQGTASTLSLSQQPLPSVSVSPSGSICEGSSIYFSGPSNMTSYSWSGPNNFSSSIRTPVILNSTSNHAGTYSLTVTSAYGCTNSGSAVLNVLAKPSFLVSYTVNNPMLTELTLHGPDGMTSYSWSGPNNFLSTSQNPIVSNSTGEASGTYTLTALGSNGCSASASVMVYGRLLDTSLPEGSTVGAFNVSSSGNATYSVPIPVPPGTAGMQPNVSINYSSGGGNGILGIGWSLNAASAITRAPADVYHDGLVDDIDFDSYDRFAMDGNRLVLNTGTYGAAGSVYFTESETFSRITAMSSTGNGPQWFRVETKNGSILEYGNTADSRTEGSGRSDVLIWYLNKVMDANGNYFTYTYHNDKTNGEYWLERIDYTGNTSTGLIPYNSVRFTYQPRSDSSTDYLYGTPFKNSQYLSKVETYNESTKVKEFQFVYEYDVYLHLKEIIEFGTDGSRLNSTMLGWYGQGNQHQHYTPPLYEDNYCFGDFNGDEKTDLIEMTGKGIFTLNSTGNGFTHMGASGIPAGEDMSRTKTGDFNGDGKIDIIIASYNTTHSFDYYMSGGYTFSFIGSYGDANSAIPNLYPYDFNGDGISDVLVRRSSGSLNIYWGNSTAPFSSSMSVSLTWGVKNYFYDFNGDGKTEIMILDANGYNIYEWDVNSFVLKLSGTSLNSSKYFYFGDYNGDGKTDFVYGNVSNNIFSGISSCISNGNGFLTGTFSFTINEIFNTISTFDSDGDGKDELMHYQDINGYIHLYSYEFENYTWIQSNLTGEIIGAPFQTYDFNGDGIIDYLCKSNIDHFKELFISIDNHRHLLSQISNGYNNVININYKLFADRTVYTPSTNGAYPISDYKSTASLVSSVSFDNGLNSQNQIEYTYAGAKFSNLLKSFIGFTTITKTDKTQGIKLKNTYEINNTYYFNTLKKSETFKVKTGEADVLLSETNNVYSTKNYGNNRFFAYLSQQSSVDYLHNNATATATYGYNDYGNLTTVSTSAGQNSTTAANTYGSYGGWCENRLLTATSTTQREDLDAYTTSVAFQYYSNGQLKQKISEPGNAKQVYTNYTYYPNGNVYTVKTSPDGVTGRTVTYEYDPKYRLVTKTLNIEGHYTQNSFDYGLGVVTQTTNHNNLITNYGYDGFGRLTQTTAPDGNISTVTTNWVTDGTPQYALYKVTAATPGNPAATTWYDKLGRAILAEGTGINGTKIYSETSYNAKGQVVYTTLPYYQGQSNADRKTFGYDALGRVTSETAPGVNVTYAYSGLTTTVTDNIKGQTYTRVMDETGLLANASDAGGTINYNYNSQGLPNQIMVSGSSITMTYDQFGRQISITDPNTGTYSYEYNVYGELTKQTDPVSRNTTLAYDNIGRITSCNQSTFNTTYTYKTNGLPDVISANNGIGYSYSYDNLLRPQQTSEDIWGEVLNTTYDYDEYGRISLVTWPSGFAVTYHYNNGYLEEIKRADNGVSIWKLNTMNSKGLITQSTTGNGLVTSKTYKNSGELLTITTGTSGSVQNLAYTYNSKGLMDSRRDNRRYLTEYFGYDNLNRLNYISQGSSSKSFGYSSNGNITSQSGIGNYVYNTQKKNAVEKITDNPGTMSNAEQIVDYTSFNKIEAITEGSNYTNFTYGPDYSRKYTDGVINGKTVEMFYSGNYEHEIVDGESRELHYVVAYGQIVAIFEKKTTTEAMHYVHTDHLGSVNVITSSTGAIEQELSYDAWGNRRNPTTWAKLTTAPANLITSRGFTGHEHMDAYGLINMNGRLYDPTLGRFLSPDPFIANPTSTQDYNRYSYVVNNPLMFTDPSGYMRAHYWLKHTGELDWDGSPIGAGGGGGNFFDILEKLWNSPYGGYWSSNGNWGYYDSDEEAEAAGAEYNDFHNSWKYTVYQSRGVYNSVKNSSNKSGLYFVGNNGKGTFTDNKTGFQLTGFGDFTAFSVQFNDGTGYYLFVANNMFGKGDGNLGNIPNFTNRVGGLDYTGYIVDGVGYSAELSAQTSYRFGQRINGRVVNSAHLTRQNAALMGKVAARFNVASGVIGVIDSGMQSYDDFSNGNYALGTYEATKGLSYLVGTALLFTPFAPIGAGILLVTGIIDIAGDVGLYIYGRNQ
jgi:RHS repeat-associated protein